MAAVSVWIVSIPGNADGVKGLLHNEYVMVNALPMDVLGHSSIRDTRGRCASAFIRAGAASIWETKPIDRAKSGFDMF
jgi:hypothetical protein